MSNRTKMWCVICALGVFGVTAVAPGALIEDDFEADTSSNYTIVDDSNAASGDGTADSTSTFAFDYIAAGIPLAPNSTAGDTGGLLFTVNDSAGEADHIAAFNNTSITATNYRLQVDMYMRVEIGQSGSTEMAHVGVAGSSSDYISIFTPVVTNGHFISITGEGGSSSDYRHSVPSIAAVPSGDSSYLDPAQTTNASGTLYQSLFPSTDFPGSPGNVWTTLTIDVTPTTVTYSLDGTPIIQATTEVSSGLISLGYTDPFTSVGPHYVIYDNLSVTEISGAVPSPSSAAVFGLLGAVGCLLRRRSVG
ncbi:hypothetical protein HED60_00710 [Planctomycetales bacterium ZRK34]|nr:hypothetical protein HED60_00710 [Planctomycetales bacterium ZRK34]